jgi:NAD(P)H-nitrite reductase large subunit
MSPDDLVCLCFRITRRKLVNYARREQPKVPSLLSQCGGAGTGCGWCIPFLKQIHRQECQAVAHKTESLPIDTLSAEEYAQLRAEYVRAGHGTPPSGAGS